MTEHRATAAGSTRAHTVARLGADCCCYLRQGIADLGIVSIICLLSMAGYCRSLKDCVRSPGMLTMPVVSGRVLLDL